ncbi:MAG: hypothetical protein Q8O89_07930 [Nanoarchaeota archaeon]|nr:hypothetical protein [Nanoarchaeota archaeon]
MKDYVIPNGNEREFIENAEKLNIKELMFLYPLTKFDATNLEMLQNGTKIRLLKAVIADKKDMHVAKRKAFDAVRALEENRAILEQGPDLMFGFEEASKKDYLHHRGSGFNQVLAKIAHDKKVSIGLSFSSLIRADSVSRAQIIGRMNQNKMLFRKYKVKFFVASFAERPEEMRAAEELKAFERVV